MELKPCPFCGGIARVYCRDGVRIKCSKCGCETPVRSDSPGEWWENGRTNALDVVIREWNCERMAGDGWTYRQHHCSLCGFQSIACSHYAYCPNCGADMKAEECE